MVKKKKTELEKPIDNGCECLLHSYTIVFTRCTVPTSRYLHLFQHPERRTSPHSPSQTLDIIFNTANIPSPYLPPSLDEEYFISPSLVKEAEGTS